MALQRVINVIDRKEERGDSTDIALLVTTSSKSEINPWDKQRIVNCLVREVNASVELAQEIADAVERKIFESNLDTVTTSIIRELVDIELLQRGLGRLHKRHTHLGLPLFDVEQIILNANRENSNTTHNPESINLTLAETILKQYALTKVFSEDVAQAHLIGDIHLHDLGFITRPYCGGHSLEYIKKYGLSLPNITSTSKPARHPEVLIGHMVKMASTLQSHYAGAIGWEAVNIFFAPFLKGLTYERIKQLAQMIIYEFNQLAGARGSQVVFTDFNLYYGIPSHFRDTPAIGPGGKYMKKEGDEIVYLDRPEEGCLTYKDFEYEANQFLKALFEVYLEGDATGKTFVFPKPLLHINEDFFRTPGWEDFLYLACKVASHQGITYFVFDRGGQVTVSQCCRLKLKLGEKDLQEAKSPEKMRFTALQNVTINLPRIAYKARGNDKVVFSELEKAMELVAKAHLQKKEFISNLLNLGERGPLAFFTASKDGEPYLRIERLTYLCGILGLNEMVQFHLGQQLHESDDALKFGLKVISFMNLKAKELSDKYGIKIVLEETPAESAAYRLAKLDMKYYPLFAKKVVKGNLEKNEFYYTNSIHLAASAPVDYIERVKKQSLFHPLIEAGAIIHIWMGESKPDPEAIKSFVIKTFRYTQAEQIAFSPEFTVCESCERTTRGLFSECPKCGSDEVYGITRIVGYFSKITTWNKGKIGELKERQRTDLSEAKKPMGGEHESKVFLQERLPEVSGC
jgi:ribonucleoside-triphosphate reductase